MTPKALSREQYNSICTEQDCYTTVKEDDIERGIAGNIYERSKKCWDCRTNADKIAIKRFRKETHKKLFAKELLMDIIKK